MISKPIAAVFLALIAFSIETANGSPTFVPSARALYKLRGGSDSPQDDASTPTIETSVIESSLPTQNSDESSVRSYEAAVPEPVVAESTPTVNASEKKKVLNPKLTNAIERTGPALVLLGAIFLLVKMTGEKGLQYGLIPLMQLGMYSESTGIIEAFHEKGTRDVEVKLEKWWWFATVFACTTLRLLGGVGNLKGTAMDLACFGMVSIGLVMGVVGMARHQSAGPEMFRKYLGEVAGFHFALIFLVGQSSFWIKTIQSFGMEWVIYPALLVVVNDTMAYVFGMLMGKHKLLPRLSPKKTVEGFIGGGVSTCAIALPLLKFFVNNIFTEGGKAAAVLGESGGDIVKHALMLGLYISFIAPFGGFLASAVKRAHNAKDFGTLIPGHGGVVDRFDCQVVTAPFVFLYLASCLAK